MGETGRSMRKRIKEHDRNIRFVCTQSCAASEHAYETGHIPIWSDAKFIDNDPHQYTHRVKEAIHRLHPNNINKDSGVERSKNQPLNLYDAQFTFSAQLIVLNYLVILSHPRSTAVLFRNLPPSNNTVADQYGPMRKTPSNDRNNNRIEMHQQQRTNVLQIATLKQSTSSPDEDQQYCSRNVAINIHSDTVVRQTNKVHLLSYITMNNNQIFYLLHIYRKELHACFIVGSASIECSEIKVIFPAKLQPHVSSTGSHYSNSVISTEFTEKIGRLITAITNFKI